MKTSTGYAYVRFGEGTERSRRESLNALLAVVTPADAEAFVEKWHGDNEPRMNVDEVLSRATAMRFAARAACLLTGGVSVERLEALGVSVVSYGGRVSCHKRLPLVPGPGGIDMTISYSGSRVENEAAALEGALSDMLDDFLTQMLSGVNVVSHGLARDVAAPDGASRSWLFLLDLLEAGRIRTCRACGRPFVIEIGTNGERGKSRRSYCSDACKTAGARARRAIALMDRGLSLHEAASGAHISEEKLRRYIDLNITEGGAFGQA